MHNRGGFPVRNAITGVVVILMLYMLFIYNGCQNRLREAEMLSARQKREANERSFEIQELLKSKDSIQEGCQNEKHELNNRIKSNTQQHSMLQSQYKEVEADFIKVKQDMDILKGEHMQAESQHAQEYQALKQQKDMEISDLKDQVANMRRQNSELEHTISSLREQIDNHQTDAQYLAEQTRALEQNVITLQNSQQKLIQHNTMLQQELDKAQQQQQQQQHSQNLVQTGNFGQGKAHGGGFDGLVRNMKIPNLPVAGNAFPQKPEVHQGAPHPQNQGFGLFPHNQNLPGSDGRYQARPGLDAAGGVPGQGHNQDALKNDMNKDANAAKPNLDEQNALHQVQPPKNNEPNEEEETEGAGDENKDPRGAVNPNDEQNVQILEPLLETGEKNNRGGEGGGEADGADRMDVRQMEEDREKGVQKEEEEDEGFPRPNNPLALGQIEEPAMDDDQEENNNQQQPPILIANRKDDREGDDRDPQYFEDDQQGKNDLGRREQEEEEDEQLEEEEMEEDDRRQEEEEEEEEEEEGHLEDDEAAQLRELQAHVGNLAYMDGRDQNAFDRMQ